MPYLHWDTSRKRQQVAREITRVMKNHEYEIRSNIKKQKRQRQGRDPPTDSDEACSNEPLHKWNWPLILDPQKANNTLKRDDNDRLLIKNKIGQYLLDAARLYEGMANYRDKTVLRQFLTQNRSLHPRRTLDQAYYWILKSTKKRDRDQVVYRGTTPRLSDFHKYDRDTKNWSDHPPNVSDCEKCTTNIQKLSRVVMVDQLWMWILDRNTILTCFPRRYGTNKQDISGVHKSIRIRLKEDESVRINSVYDLALIIIDECFDTFFDRTKKVDRQPQVIDEFSKAIGNIVSTYTNIAKTHSTNRFIDG